MLFREMTRLGSYGPTSGVFFCVRVLGICFLRDAMLIFHARLCIAVDAYRLDSTSAPSKIGIQLIRFTTAVAVE